MRKLENDAEIKVRNGTEIKVRNGTEKVRLVLPVDLV